MVPLVSLENLPGELFSLFIVHGIFLTFLEDVLVRRSSQAVSSFRACTLFHDLHVLVLFSAGCRCANHVPVLKFQEKAIIRIEKDLAHKVRFLDHFKQVDDV